jgi:hypothetical protein
VPQLWGGRTATAWQTEHFLCYSRREVGDGLVFLYKMGYKNVLIYDNQGYLIGRDTTGNSKLLTTLAGYAIRHPWFYMNLVAFHETRKDIEQFYSYEMSAEQEETTGSKVVGSDVPK